MWDIRAVFTSPAERAVRTAKLAGLDDAEQDPDLWEWDYGGYEGTTTEQIRAQWPGWYLWRDGVIPGDAEHPGETVQEVGARADAVLDRVRPLLSDNAAHGGDHGDGDVVLVAHGHVLRVLTARWLGLEPSAGRLFRLDTGTLSTLGTEHDYPVITGWNFLQTVTGHPARRAIQNHDPERLRGCGAQVHGQGRSAACHDARAGNAVRGPSGAGNPVGFRPDPASQPRYRRDGKPASCRATARMALSRNRTTSTRSTSRQASPHTGWRVPPSTPVSSTSTALASQSVGNLETALAAARRIHL